jgi:hypothetical protein
VITVITRVVIYLSSRFYASLFTTMLWRSETIVVLYKFYELVKLERKNKHEKMYQPKKISLIVYQCIEKMSVTLYEYLAN